MYICQTIGNEGRSGRPRQVHVQSRQRTSEAESHDPNCPFCPGNELLTGPSLLEIPWDNDTHHHHRHHRHHSDSDPTIPSSASSSDLVTPKSSNWALRVIKNKYPAVSIDKNNLNKNFPRFDSTPDELHSSFPTVGYHISLSLSLFFV